MKCSPKEYKMLRHFINDDTIRNCSTSQVYTAAIENAFLNNTYDKMYVESLRRCGRAFYYTYQYQHIPRNTPEFDALIDLD